MDSIACFFEEFSSISNDSALLVNNCIEIAEIKANTIIVREGDLHPYMYIIRKGMVRGYTENSDGTEDTNSFWKECETFGDVKSYITNGPVTKSYQALEDLIVYKVDKVKFRKLFYENIELANLGRIIVENFIFKSDIRQQILAEQKPTDRYLTFCKLRKGIHSKVKLKYIASFLQITPETLSRVRSAS